MDIINYSKIKKVEADLASHKEDYMQFKNDSTLESAKIEKELNDYKATLAGMNPNQEPKQKVNGYGIIPLPKNAANGQISVTLKGNTYTNFIKNGNFGQGTTGWVGSGATLSATNNTLSVVGTGVSSSIHAYQTTQLDNVAGKKVYVRAKVKVTNNVCTAIQLYPSSLGAGYSNTPVVINNPLMNQVYIISCIGIAQTTDSNKCRINIRHLYADAATANEKVLEVQEVIAIDLTATFGAGQEPSKEQCDKIFAYWFDGTKSTIGSARISSADDTGEVKDKAYITAVKDGKIVNLRSLPNGTKDEIRLSESKATIRIGAKTNIASDTVINYTDMADGGQFVAYYEDGTQQVGIKGDTLTATATTLIYQLATPIEIPIQTSGSLVSYPSGTVYIEPFVADAGIYTDKMSVLHQDLPIKALEKLSKIDFMTGLETELDVSDAVIAEDKLSFTHPDLVDGDIVFFTYEYDRESTVGETEIEYYDSRYVIKDSVTDKFYKWHIVVADGVASIQLTEV